MKKMRKIFYYVLFLCVSCSLAIAAKTSPRQSTEQYAIGLQSNVNGGLNLVLHEGEKDEQVLAHIGRTLGAITLQTDYFAGSEASATAQLSNNINFTFGISVVSGVFKATVKWTAPSTQRLVDCVDFGDKQWFGGPEQKNQYWPSQNLELSEYSYVSKEVDNSGIIERYWLNSAGQYYYVQPEVPLFVDYNVAVPGHLCFVSEIKAPYSNSRDHSELSYDIWFMENAKVAHQHAVDNYLGKPSGTPDFRMVQHPVWSTWAQFSRDINHTVLLQFVNKINENEFNNAQLEIDDLWEVCYGSLTVDTNKFPNFTDTVRQIKSLGFRVTIWVHPFINRGCDPWYTEALEKGYFAVSETGSVDSTWWNNNGTLPGYIDFTNPEAANWWADRVRSIVETYDIDSVKFDGGEASFSPQIPVQNGDIYLHPHNIVEEYVKICATFGNAVEVRPGFRTQNLVIFVRMVDKDTLWGFENGLATVVTSLLQMNMNGYTLILPDMIGGNGYNERPSKELFIRWLQANVFMPVLQYSFVPWDFDAEAIEISHKYTNLHAEYANKINEAMEASVSLGTPVNAPIWWVDPTDEVALGIWDEFLLGEDLLVAPVLTQGAVSRDIYLPAGIWLAEGDEGREYEGGQWIRDYPAPLDHLPYFVRANAAAVNCLGVLLIMSAVINFFI